MTLWMRQRQLSAIMTTSWIFGGSRCRISSWLIRMRNGECPTFLWSFPWHVSPGPASGACSPVLFPFSPIQNFLGWGGGWELQQPWLMGSPPHFSVCHSPLSISLPHCPQSVGHLQAAAEPPIPLGQQTDCYPLAGFGSLSFLIAGTLCGCGVLKATSESR